MTAITVMLLVGAFAVSNSLYSRFDEYFLETKIEDASFVTLTPIPDEELKELIRHYMVYGMIPAVAGDVLGLLFSFPFAKAFCGFYFADAEYLDYVVRLPWKLMLVAFLIPIVVYGAVSYLVLCRALSSDIVPEYGFNGLPAAGRESVSDSKYCIEAVKGAGNADLRDDRCDDVRDDRGGEQEKYFDARCAWVSHGIFHDPCRGAVLGNDYEPAGQSRDDSGQLSVCRRSISAGNAVIRAEVEKGGYGRKLKVCVGVNGNKPNGLVLPFKIIRQETPTSCNSWGFRCFRWNNSFFAYW